MKFVLGLVTLILFVGISNLHAEELRIGHLETHDDTATNWLYLHCDKQGVTLTCDAFQTFIHEINPSQREAEIGKLMQGDPAKNFKDALGESCPHSSEILKQLNTTAITGKGADGRDVSPTAAASGVRLFKAVDAACRDPSEANVRNLAEVMADDKLKSCKVHNDWSRMIFSWNQPTNAWVLQEGPTGPCSTIAIGTLEKDPSSQFGYWLYTEKKIRTKPEAEIRTGLSCKQFPESVFKYTWRSRRDALDCTSVESEMD